MAGMARPPSDLERERLLERAVLIRADVTPRTVLDRLVQVCPTLPPLIRGLFPKTF